jgi:hypothetical protein
MTATVETQKNEYTEENEVRAYFVLSIKELEQMLRKARRNSRSLYDGEVNPISCTPFYLSVNLNEKLMSGKREYQASVNMKRV